MYNTKTHYNCYALDLSFKQAYTDIILKGKLKKN